MGPLLRPIEFGISHEAYVGLTSRLARVVSKLKSEIDKRAIICLQEVSRDWSGKLHALFQ